MVDTGGPQLSALCEPQRLLALTSEEVVGSKRLLALSDLYMKMKQTLQALSLGDRPNIHEAPPAPKVTAYERRAQWAKDLLAKTGISPEAPEEERT
jgi:hypothetical protein